MKLYKEATSKFTNYIEKEFKHLKHGESKQLKEKSFPLTFKHYFFKIYRAMDKNSQKQTDNKVGFWAPAGNFQSKNQKVVVESKLKKQQDVWETRQK